MLAGALVRTVIPVVFPLTPDNSFILIHDNHDNLVTVYAGNQQAIICQAAAF